GRNRVFQLPVKAGPASDFYLRAQPLFDDAATHAELMARIEAGAAIEIVPATASGGTKLGGYLGAGGIPMFIVTPGKRLDVLVSGDRPTLVSGQELIGLVNSGRTKRADPPRSASD